MLWDTEIRAHPAQAGASPVTKGTQPSSSEVPDTCLVSSCTATVRAVSVDIMSASYKGLESLLHLMYKLEKITLYGSLRHSDLSSEISTIAR